MHRKDLKTVGVDVKQHVQVHRLLLLLLLLLRVLLPLPLLLKSCRWESRREKVQICRLWWPTGAVLRGDEGQAAEGQTTLTRRTAKNPSDPLKPRPPLSTPRPPPHPPALWPPVAGAKLSCRLLQPPPHPTPTQTLLPAVDPHFYLLHVQ